MPSNRKKIQTGGIHLWLVLWKAYSAMREYAERDIASLNLSLTDFGILEALLHKGPMGVNEIGKKVGLTSGSMTVAVDRLEKRSFVERRSDSEDRRARVVHLTEEGLKLIECAFGAHAEAMTRVSEVLSDREQEQAIRLLKKLGRHAEVIERAQHTR
jgi:MarR family transcriptional regulator, 2-MHQ and catechol-resistance regulon repressor